MNIKRNHFILTSLVILFVLITITSLSATDLNNNTKKYDAQIINTNSLTTNNTQTDIIPITNEVENNVNKLESSKTSTINKTLENITFNTKTTKTNQVNSEKIDPDIRLNNNPITPGQNTTFIAIVPSDATGTSVFKINGKTISQKINITSTYVHYTYQVPSSFTNPTYNLTFVYSGNSQYNSKNISTIIKLTSKETNVTPTLSLNTTTVKYQSQVPITLNLPVDATGTVVFKINKKTITDKIRVTNATATFNFNATYTPNEYTIQAVYSGNYKYSNNTIKSYITITKVSSNVTINNITSKAGSNTIFKARVIDELNKPVNNTVVAFKLNGNTIGQATTNNTGYAVYKYILPVELNNQEYTINVISGATKTVDSSKTNATLHLNQLSTKVIVPTISSKINDTISLTATVIDENKNNVLKGYVTFLINNKILKTVNISKGYAVYNYVPPTNVATKYNVVAKYTGYWKYASNNATGVININKIGTITTTRYADAKNGNTVVLSASVKDKNQKNVNGGVVRFTLNGTVVGNTTVKNGAANLTYNVKGLQEGLYRLNATYMGSDSYLSSYNLNYLNVSTLDTRIISNPVYVKVGNSVNITVTIIDEASHYAENGIVEFKINSTVIGRATVHNGIATLKYTPLYKYSGLTLKYVATLLANKYYTSAYTINDITVSCLNTVYVSPTGNDNNLGDKSHPFKTIAYAVGHVSTYGVVNIANGNYNAYNIMLNNTVTIKGSSAPGTIINGMNYGKPIFTVTNGSSFVKISSLTLYNGMSTQIRTAGAIVSYGRLNITNVKFQSNKATGDFSGGAVYSVGSLNLTSCVFLNNSLSNNNAQGGAIRAINNTTMITSTSFVNNTVKGSNDTGGAAIYFQDGSMIIEKGVFTSNHASGKTVLGGAIRAVYGDMVIVSTKFNSNIINGVDCGIGGAISSLGCGLYLNNTIIQNNEVYATTFAGAGAIYTQYAAMDIYNSNITSNIVKSKSVLGGTIEGYYAYCNLENDNFKSNICTATSTTAFGGVIYSNMGNLTINKCAFIENQLKSSNISIGGAIYSYANTIITNSDFKLNKVTGKTIGGGAIANMGNLTVTKTNFISNNASNIGNAITSVTGATNNINTNYWGEKNPTWTNLLRGVTKPSNYSTTVISH